MQILCSCFYCHGVHQKAKNRGRKNWNSVLMWQRGGWGAKKLFGQCTKNTDYQKGVSLSDWQLKKVNDRTTRLLLAVLVLFVLAELPQVTGQLYFSWFLAVKMWATLHFLCWSNNASKDGNCSKRQKNNCCTHPIPLRVLKFMILLSREQFPQNTFQLEQIIIVSPKST